MRGKALAVVGTASSVGKSSIAAALMYYYANKKMRVAPFKALNVTGNIGQSAAGLPMAQSQIKQAQACLRAPLNIFNPLLVKPTKTKMAFYLEGVLQDNIIYNSVLLDYCLEKYQELAKENDLVVIEGSGSCTELNLKEQDIANFLFINKIQAPTILVANIEHCGVFASIYGTLNLLTEAELALIKGIVINKYCGDIAYFSEGRKIIEELTNKPVLGVVPLDTKSTSLEQMWSQIIGNIDMPAIESLLAL